MEDDLNIRFGIQILRIAMMLKADSIYFSFAFDVLYIWKIESPVSGFTVYVSFLAYITSSCPSPRWLPSFACNSTPVIGGHELF